MPEMAVNINDFGLQNLAKKQYQNVAKWQDSPSENDAKFEPENHEENFAEVTDEDLAKKQGAKPRNRINGSGDTDTEGKHAKRFRHYKKLIMSGKINPTIYAMTGYVMDGKKIGTPTAKIWLAELERQGIIAKQGQTYVLLNSKVEA